ncbi:MAG: hypothetical protein SVU88_03090 [Candidatus Nanohaloarchaea archaeon]|nr:hypothetical protein [Candidatus Nanohaloarchaea archaeon]
MAMDDLLDTERPRRTYVLAAIAIAVLVGGAYLLQGQAVLGPAEQDAGNATDEFEQYADADEETGTTETQGATVGATITVGEFGVDPASVTIDTGQAVRWTNEKDFPVRLEFDRTPQTPVIPPGGTQEMRFRGITYYDVYNADSGEQIGSGRINVQ